MINVFINQYLFDILHRFILKSWFPLSWIVLLSSLMMIISNNYIKYYLGSTEHSFTNSTEHSFTNSHAKSTSCFIINSIITYILYLFHNLVMTGKIIGDSCYRLENTFKPLKFNVKINKVIKYTKCLMCASTCYNCF